MQLRIPFIYDKNDSKYIYKYKFIAEIQIIQYIYGLINIYFTTNCKYIILNLIYLNNSYHCIPNDRSDVGRYTQFHKLV